MTSTIQGGIDGICEVRAIERAIDEEEPEGMLTFAGGVFALVKVRGSTGFVEDSDRQQWMSWCWLVEGRRPMS